MTCRGHRTGEGQTTYRSPCAECGDEPPAASPCELDVTTAAAAALLSTDRLARAEALLREWMAWVRAGGQLDLPGRTAAFLDQVRPHDQACFCCTRCMAWPCRCEQRP